MQQDFFGSIDYQCKLLMVVEHPLPTTGQQLNLTQKLLSFNN